MADNKLTNHEAEHKQLQKRVDSACVAMDTLASDGRVDEQRDAELRQRAMRWQAAQTLCEEAQRRLGELGVDPAKELQVLEGQVRHLENAVSDFDKRYHGEQVRLQTLANEAPYSALANVDETIEDLKTSIARERLRYGAIQLLFEQIQDHRKSLNQKLLGPVTERATGMLQRITGSRLGSLQLGPNFLPKGMVPDAAGVEIELDELCGGEQEQVYIATRLALAEVLFRKQRQLVVLDDALTYTDSGRFARILGILEEAASRFQILVLTCHPERYSGLAETCFFDLEKR